MKILILASNPRRDLNLDDEIRDLRDAIEKSANRQHFDVEHAPAVRVEDLQELLFKHRPQIVHFCGHGSGEKGLVFKGKDGGEQWVRAEALSDLFRLFSKDVSCVLLNACYSEEQANAIVNHVNYVIGMNQEIRDDAAIAFSKGFYRALGYDCSIEQAYDFGKNAIQLEISGSSKMRSVNAEVMRKAELVDTIQATAIPEHLKPILKLKQTPTSDPTSGLLTDIPLSQDTRTTIQLEIDESLKVSCKVKQYRDRVREFLADRKLSALEEIQLEQLKEDLGLSIEEANRILVEEQEPIWKAQKKYRETLLRLIEKGRYPFDAETNHGLQQLRQELNLTDGEVETISKPILLAAEKDHQQTKATQQQVQVQQRSTEEHQQKESSTPIASLLPEKQSIPVLVSNMQAVEQIDVDYSTLHGLLNAGRWQEADQETFKIMLKIVGTTDNWIKDYGIATFPRKDLHMLDQLWNQNSNGLFGFSIQKRVWLSVGGKAEEPNFEVYDSFGERLGWRANNKWLSYKNLTFSLDAPEGHLPICGYETDGSWMRWYWALFSRRDW